MKKNICVVGLGYVGLPLAHAFAKKKYKVIGFDINQSRISELKLGFDSTLELDNFKLKEIKNTIYYTSELNEIVDCNIFIITVPTPIDSINRPDLSPLIKSSRDIGSLIKKGDIVIYESTVYPGVTEEVCVPELEMASKLIYNKDFYCGYSPERINPGDKHHTISKILKVTSGSTPEIADVVDELYNSIIEAGTYKASSIKVAEASKVIENTQRDVNIALINELALIFQTMGIDTNEVIEAASTKWNFIKLKPGLVGGHCIGVDPYYLVHKAEELGYKPNLILGARQINNGMGKYIADQTIKTMISCDKKINKSNVLILGITFKEDCPDLRNSRVFDIIDELESYGCIVDIHDPWINEKNNNIDSKYKIINNPFRNIKKYDSIIVAVAHKEFRNLKYNDYKDISSYKPVIMDIKGIVDNPNWRL
jgi:UDP-N-acetyl-D-galactosamine dehydrogenase